MLQLVVVAALFTLPPTQQVSISADDRTFFESQIRPILAEHCYGCHSGGAKEIKSGLRLDTQLALAHAGTRGKLIVARKPGESLLITAVKYEEPRLLMPPKGRLPLESIAKLNAWIEKGAPWPPDRVPIKPIKMIKPQDPRQIVLGRAKGLWSFKLVTTPPVPKLKNSTWPLNPIDTFVLAELEKKGIKPNRAADRRTLIRRATFDLTGLPPTRKEVEEFLNDRAPNAYAKLVDRLLASPAYGERWARHWLDLVRYAETDGHEYDFEKPTAFEYRDYVIRALNADVPYNQFVREHLAGDLLAKPRTNPKDGFNESIIATGFWWLGEGKHSPVDLLEDEAERTDNMIDVLGRGVLGLTLGCARCHDHKFDPITQRDYYALAGIIKSSRQQDADVSVTDKVRQNIANLRDRTEVLLGGPLAEKLRAARLASGEAKLKQVETQPLTDASNALYLWSSVYKELTQNPGGKPFAFIEAAAKAVAQARDKAITFRRDNICFPRFTSDEPSGYNGWRREGEAFGPGPSSSLDRTTKQTAAQPGIADSGSTDERLSGALRSPTMILQKKFLWFRLAGKGPAKINLIVDNFQRIRDPLWGKLTLGPSNSTALTWQSINLEKLQGHKAYIEAVDPGNGWIALSEVIMADEKPPTEPDPRLLSRMAQSPPQTKDDLLNLYRALLAEGLADEVRNVDWPTFEADKGLPEHCVACLKDRMELAKGLPAARMVMAAADGTGLDDRVHMRGSTKNLAEAAPRKFLAACAADMPAVGPATSGRLELADRLLSSQTPLTARVIANRLWHHHFGAGLVRSTDDFGLMGLPPTHPKLLDWLASEVVRRGWSLKQMHRVIMLSQTYKMSSAVDEKTEAADPENKLWHRFPVKRLEAEAIRDSILAVSGRLNPKMHGPSVMPYLSSFMDGRGRPDKSGPLDGDGRRSIYLGVRRNFLNPFFLAFDFPVPFATMGKRTVSNVPAQALAMMNNPLVVEQAEVWARRVIAGFANPQERIKSMYEEALSRQPTSQELASGLQFVEDQKKTYTERPEEQAWRDLCHVLFNVKEFVFVG